MQICIFSVWFCLLAFLTKGNHNVRCNSAATFHCVGNNLPWSFSSTAHPWRRIQALLSVLGLQREYSLSSHLVIEWEAAGNISKCKLTFNYTKISFRDHFSCQADSDPLEYVFLFVDSWFSSSYWEQLEMLDLQSCYFSFYPIHSLADAVIRKMMFLLWLSKSLTSTLTFSKCACFPISMSKIEYLYKCHLKV